MLSESVEGRHGRFVSDGVDHALEGFSAVDHSYFEELRVFAFVSSFQETRFGIVEEHVQRC